MSAEFDIANYQIKAEQGDADAQYQLGICYAQGNGVEKILLKRCVTGCWRLNNNTHKL